MATNLPSLSAVPSAVFSADDFNDFHIDDNPDVLNVPEINLDLPIPDDDGKAACPRCGRSFKVKADGTLRQHKCTPGTTANSDGGTTSVRRSQAVTVRRAKNKAPDTVRRMGVALIGAGVESGASFTIGRYVPMDRGSIPEDVVTLPDADAMIGPFIDRLWPELPKGTQALLKRLSEMEDLITAMFLWSQWTRTVGQYASETREYRLQLEARQKQESTTQNHTTNGVPADGSLYGPNEFRIPVPDSGLVPPGR